MTDVLIAVCLALLIRLLVFEPVRVRGRSMMDTLRDKEVMLVTKYDYLLGQPRRFDVVTCRYPNRRQTFVKRIVGLPGDTLTIQDGVLSVNGVPCPEPHITHRPRYTVEAYTVPAGHYYVLGDNRCNSNDSHLVGPLTRRQIVGHVRAVVYPFRQRRIIR